MKNVAIGIAALALASAASAQMRITEWMYSGASGEFVEFTNIGNAAIDMTGWSYDDDSRTPGVVDLSAYGVVQPGQSVILTELTAVEFRTNWALADSLGIIGENSANLSRNDEINLFDSSAALVDRLTFGDQNFPGSIRTQNKSGSTELENLGANTVLTWDLAAVGDVYGSFTSSGGDVANPGIYTLVPAPGTLLLTVVAGFVGARRRRA